MAELDDTLYSKIVALSNEGDELQEIEAWKEAIAKFDEAVGLLPAPKHQWEAATWLLVAIGDVAFEGQQFQRALEALNEASLCPGATGNPFVHLRRGQSLFELGDIREAENELAEAFRLDGVAIFEGEDPKYLEVVRRAR